MRCEVRVVAKRFVTCGASSSAITSFFTRPQQKKKRPDAASFAGQPGLERRSCWSMSLYRTIGPAIRCGKSDTNAA
jgi:hypothetical protein